jgi:hypothetical protein
MKSFKTSYKGVIMKKFNEVKKNVNKFCQDHILGITATVAAGIWIGCIALTIRDIKNANNNVTDCTDSLMYELDPANVMILVPDADHIDDAIKFIKENNVLNPLERDEFQRIIDTFTELKNGKN